jgi:putative transferase (TIGR04331 family)
MPNYIQSGFDFLRALDSEVYNSVQCKPYLTDYGWGYEECLRRAGLPPTTANWEKRNAAELLPLVRFVVVDHPGTSLLESLVINTPTILFWNPEHWRMRDEAKPFFDLLRSVNILHDSPLDAAGHCETIFEDPLKWWMSCPVQEVREAFIGTYALTSADCETEWRTMIDSLVEGSLFDYQKAQSLQVSHV